MKFAQYLQDSQTPEWKRAYIDYHGLKKLISVIKNSQQTHLTDSAPNDSWPTFPTDSRRSSVVMETASLEQPDSSGQLTDSPTERLITRPSLVSRPRNTSLRARLSSFRLFKGKTSVGQENERSDPRVALAGLPFHQLVAILPPRESAFIGMLDTELEKVDSFYRARESEMLARGHLLQRQLKELHDHRNLLITKSPVTWTASLRSSIFARLSSQSITSKTASSASQTGPNSSEIITASTSSAINPFIPSTATTTGTSFDEDHSTISATQPRSSQYMHSQSADPDSYFHAKRKLKKAVMEHYRGLELLHNYRVLNMTGFRKALKKFEKVTKIPIQNKYMSEKVETTTLATDKSLLDMMDQMEVLYASSFFNGNKKKATQRLRIGSISVNHHFSIYRSGLWMGIALPPLIDGLVKVSKESTRNSIGSWNVLLLLYGVLLVPVLFSVLIGLNLLVWSETRINFVFIFELKASTRLDYREYFEIPTILLTALCYCFWLSFSQHTSQVDPTTWPLIWIFSALFFIFQPLPIFHRSTRYWFLKNLAAQLMAGIKPVEFTDFWLGDQLCSLTFTLSNIYTFACVYREGFPNNLNQCGAAGSHWAVIFSLAALPLVIRLVQSVRRYADSGLPTHLINGGKYGAGIVMNFFYFSWRHSGNNQVLFTFWCLSATCYSIYACAWDFLADWSLLRLHNTTYPLLRENLLYSDHVYVYYLALMSNLLLRFLWVIYIPTVGPSMMARTFIIGSLEMLRRVQWNFFRLENEHLGNMDQYRVTREVPLPYAIDDARRLEEDDHDDVLVKRRSG